MAIGYNCYVVYISFTCFVDLKGTICKFECCKSTVHHWCMLEGCLYNQVPQHITKAKF